MTEEESKCVFTDITLRLSFVLEDIDDLFNDLKQALNF